MEDFKKIKDGFSKLFISLYGETFLVGKSIKVKFNGVDSIVSNGSRIIIAPNFIVISTNKSFTYNFLYEEISSICKRVLKYVKNLDSDKNITLSVSFDIPDVYIIDSDRQTVENNFYNLKRISLDHPNINGELDIIEITPLFYNIKYDDGGVLDVEFDVFLKSGEITLKDGEKYSIPFHHSLDSSVKLQFTNSVSPELQKIIDTLINNTLGYSEETFTVRINPSF